MATMKVLIVLLALCCCGILVNGATRGGGSSAAADEAQAVCSRSGGGNCDRPLHGKCGHGKVIVCFTHKHSEKPPVELCVDEETAQALIDRGLAVLGRCEEEPEPLANCTCNTTEIVDRLLDQINCTCPAGAPGQTGEPGYLFRIFWHRTSDLLLRQQAAR